MNTIEQNQWQLNRGQYLGEISALCFIHLPPPHTSSLPLLLAGIGSQILVYNLKSGDVIRSFQVFEGVRVHGISLGNSPKLFPCTSLVSLVAIYGERKVKLFSLKIEPERNVEDMELTLMYSLPKFGNWVMDVCFLKDDKTASEGASFLTIGCSDNSVYFWNMLEASMSFEVKSSEKCLIYSMRMFGNEIKSLRIASGTIFNEIVVWKVVQNHSAIHEEDHARLASDEKNLHLCSKYKDALISRLIGHEGSIFRIAWFSNGLKLISVSDDRSACIWEIEIKEGVACKRVTDKVNHSAGPVLFGHNARIWDCCIFDSLIITVGEDCTCRVWDNDGRELIVIKEHIGRGVWRCLYDPTSSLLVTAGFDSAIKVHQLHTSSKGLEGNVIPDDFSNSKEMFAISLPSLSERGGPMDSGYLYHANLFTNGSVQWTELARVCGASPIICMDILSRSSPPTGGFDDWIATGDGKGNMTVVLIVGMNGTPKVEYAVTWLAEKERHLLDAYWCKSLDNSFIFTADPGGRLKLWKLCHNYSSHNLFSKGNGDVYLIAEYTSSFGMRILCVDVSLDEELLACGDIRGNLLLFSLPRGLLCSAFNSSEMRASPVNYFKGAHGVSSVNSVCISSVSSDQVDIQSTGADGCICYLQHDRDMRTLEFVGMKQVKELSAIRSAFTTTCHSENFSVSNYAVGFASANFIIWNVTAGTKVVQITCGGWRRPHSYYLGDFPEIMNCFSFVKDDVIYIHRNWAPKVDTQIYPRNVHFQFHGREIHSLCFISGRSLSSSDEEGELHSECSWVATGCEDGTVRLTRYQSGMQNWSSSQHLGEHIGGSAVRSICCVSKMYMFMPDAIAIPNLFDRQNEAFEDKDPFILISVGAKRVITAWKQMIKMYRESLGPTFSVLGKKNESDLTGSCTATSSFSFQWLSSDVPFKQTGCVKRQNAKEPCIKDEDLSTDNSDTISVETHSSDYREMEPTFCPENDWRYLDVTAFLVKIVGSRISVCFVLVACSDTTVTLRALVLPFRLWFDVTSFTPLSSPVLALQHVVIPKLLPSKESIPNGNIYLAITGSTDGSIAIWDLTESVENFMWKTSFLQVESYLEIKERPRTGRGSQGGRWWRSINRCNAQDKKGYNFSRKKTQTGAVSAGRTELGSERESQVCGTCLSEKSNRRFPSEVGDQGSFSSGRKEDDLSPETTVLVAMHVLENVHQSGVNCLSVTDIKDFRFSGSSCSFCVVSGGDDQAINCLRCDVNLNLFSQSSQHEAAKVSTNNWNQHFVIQNHQMQFHCLHKIVSAHSSAVKGVWTDGIWIFSVGLDQRVRCWSLADDRLAECAHLIINVPEPEALDAKPHGRDHYQIAVAGRGMQMVEFCPSDKMASDSR